MKKNLQLILIFLLQLGFAQQAKAQNIKDKYAQSQPQDLSVPPPPVNVFPAQFPKGNKVFIQKVKENMDVNLFQDLPQELNTKIILKIDTSGNVFNVSTYGNNEKFNTAVKNAVQKATNEIKWEPAKNKLGEKVIDIVQIPFNFVNK